MWSLGGIEDENEDEDKDEDKDEDEDEDEGVGPVSIEETHRRGRLWH